MVGRSITQAKLLHLGSRSAFLQQPVESSLQSFQLKEPTSLCISEMPQEPRAPPHHRWFSFWQALWQKPGKKQRAHFGAMWLTRSWGSRLMSASEVGEQSSRHWTTRDLRTLHNINQWQLSQRSPYQCSDPAPISGKQAPVLDAQCQTTSKTGTQPHALAERLPKIILSSQTPQNTPPDWALPTRKTRSSPTHQNTGISPLHQEAYTTHWTNLTHWGKTPKTLGTTNLLPAKRRPQTQ